MKIKILLYGVISLISFNNWAQNNIDLLNVKKINGTATNSLTMDNNKPPINMKVKYYHVEEIFPMKFGGHKKIYNVSNQNLIETYDLGPNNKRTVTPVFTEIQQAEKISLKSDTLIKTENTKLSISDVAKKADTNASVKSINTAERASGKEDSSADMLKIKNDKLSISDVPKKTDTVAFVKTINTLERDSGKGNSSADMLKNKNTKLPVSDVPKKTDTIATIEIINRYEKAVNKRDTSLDMLKMVANYYFFNNELLKAEKCYTKLFDKTSDLMPSYYFHYAISLQAVGKTKKSTEYYKKFQQLTANKIR